MRHLALEVADIFRSHGPAWRKSEQGHLDLLCTGVKRAFLTSPLQKLRVSSSCSRLAVFDISVFRSSFDRAKAFDLLLLSAKTIGLPVLQETFSRMLITGYKR